MAKAKDARTPAKKRSITLKLPSHMIVYQYADVPGEIHTTCLEAGAFGSGQSIPEAFDSLLKSIQAQFEASDDYEYGKFGFFRCGPDPEWIEAYKTGKHPAIESIVVELKGRMVISATLGDGKPKLRILPEIECESSIRSETLQPA